MKNSEIIDFLKDLWVIIVIIVFIRSFIGMPFQISGQSMADSYYNKEFIVVDRLSYIFWSPNRWDVIVFKPNVDKEKKYFLKRIIWIPGDNIKIEEGKVFLQTEKSGDYIELNEEYLNTENNWYTFVGNSSGKVEYRLWEDQYFVMWDNRNHSTDSRECFYTCALEGSTNFISSSDITGKIFLDLGFFNFWDFSFIHPEFWVDTTPKFFSSPATFEYKNL